MQRHFAQHIVGARQTTDPKSHVTDVYVVCLAPKQQWWLSGRDKSCKINPLAYHFCDLLSPYASGLMDKTIVSINLISAYLISDRAKRILLG